MDKSHTKNKKSKVQLILLALAFIVPILLAKLALTSGFKGEIKTHGGQLLSLDKTYNQMINTDETDALTPTEGATWRIVYVGEKRCEERCANGLYHIQQIYKALGRLQERVSLGRLTGEDEGQSISDGRITMSLFSHDVLNQLEFKSLNDTVIIIDPMGNLVMNYRFDGETKQNLIKAHDMLLDIKQLLKLSRIG